MRNKMKFVTILFACLLTVMMASSGFSADAKKVKSSISAAERALAMWEVQNVMSKHAYYHAAGMHLEELADIWVDEKGPNANTATFSSPGWIMHGIAGVKKYYGEGHQKDKETALAEVAKLYPNEIKNTKEYIGVGAEFAMHTQTTPIIIIAGDGKTAKGIWYSPGIGLSAHIQGSTVSYGGTFFWEKYGADFMCENGVWKLWHCQMFYDFTPSLPTSMTSSIGGGGMGGGGQAADQAQGGAGAAPGGQGGAAPAAGGAAPGGQGGAAPAAGGAAPGGQGGAAPAAGGAAPGGQAGAGAIEAGEKMQGKAEAATAKPGDMTSNPNNHYQNYSVKRVPTIEPKFPVDYYTFSETFSY
jgi:hypothetical protein